MGNCSYFILFDYTTCIVPEYSGCTFHAVNQDKIHVTAYSLASI